MKINYKLASILLAAFLLYAQSPAEANTNEIVGPLVFKSLDDGHLWIYVDRFTYWAAPDARSRAGWMIQMDGLYNPYKYLGYVHDESLLPIQTELNDAIYRSVNTLIAGNTNLWLMVTNERFAPPGEVGGLLFTDSGQAHTLQEHLISEGYARVNRAEINPRIPSEYLNTWEKLEDEARRASRGFWKTHPEAMKRYWDKE